VEFFDETLRDGLQNPSVKDPSIEEKLELIHLMDSLGIHAADIGLPGSTKRAYDDVLRMCQEIVSLRSSRSAPRRRAHRGRRHPPDGRDLPAPGIPLEVYTFIGSSPIRLFAEGWDVDRCSRTPPRPSISR
jgi:2-isopropylmalate synthase